VLTLELWWPLMLLPAPILASWLLSPASLTDPALAVPFLQKAASSSRMPGSASGRLTRALLWMLWISLVLAVCQPYWLGEPDKRVLNGRDLLLAIDISGSMQETDMLIGSTMASRIGVLKSVVSGFIKRREGDRLGLILFGTRAYTYVPLTFDRRMLNQMLIETSTGLAGRLTAIGDAIGISIRTLGEQQARHKVLILVTDGSNTGGSSDPLTAARIAAHQGMTIYTIGVGNDDARMRQLVKEQNISAGTILNDTLLQQIAGLTGGQYFRARDSASLERIYQQLNLLEPVAINAGLHRPRIDLFAWLVGLALLCLLLALVQLPLRSWRLEQQ
jgi:Ca-activated chloride channel family protein